MRLKFSGRGRVLIRVFRTCLTIYRRRGIAYFVYLVRGWFVPCVQYCIFFKTNRRAETFLRQIPAAMLAAAATLLFGWYGMLSAALIYLVVLLAARGLRISEKSQIFRIFEGRFRANAAGVTMHPVSSQTAPEDKPRLTVSYDSKENFLNQVISMYALSSQLNVPSITGVDESDRVISSNFINGQILLRMLPALPERESDAIIGKVETQMNRIHAMGITGLSRTLRTILLDQKGEVWLTDFTQAQFHNSFKSLRYRLERDRDREEFNRLFHRSILTERLARELLKKQAEKMDEWYAPVDFGNGLTAGHFWAVDCGTGRWEYLNGKILEPIVSGKRILDLGCNIGIMDILMLRAGAKEVVGLEQSALAAETADVVKRIYEWRDQRTYHFSVYNGNMLNMLEKDYGKSDVVSAFCSLYYVSEEEMRMIVRKASELAPVMIVQTTLHEVLREEKLRKSTVEFLTNLLQENGFPHVRIIAPRGYSRPLLIGRCAKTMEDLTEPETQGSRLRIRQLV